MLSAARSMGYGGIQGVQVSAPFGRYAVAAEVIAEVLPRPSAPACQAESLPAKGRGFGRPEEKTRNEGLQPLRESSLGNV
jgi:hypothetical protein